MLSKNVSHGNPSIPLQRRKTILSECKKSQVTVTSRSISLIHISLPCFGTTLFCVVSGLFTLIFPLSLIIQYVYLWQQKYLKSYSPYNFHNLFSSIIWITVQLWKPLCACLCLYIWGSIQNSYGLADWSMLFWVWVADQDRSYILQVNHLGWGCFTATCFNPKPS